MVRVRWKAMALSLDFCFVRFRQKIGRARVEPVVLAVRPDVVNESGLLSLYLESERAVA
jgi:hypothetical protein